MAGEDDEVKEVTVCDSMSSAGNLQRELQELRTSSPDLRDVGRDFGFSLCTVPLSDSCPKILLNLYAIYARYGTINILLPFTDLLRNARPYVARPASFSSHLLLRS